MAAAVVADMVARGYVDDAAFARQWVEARATRGYGAARLRAELAARGVGRAIVDEVLGALDPGQTLERAREAARRRLPALRRGDPVRVARRLADFLLRRGHAAGVVARVVRECTGVAPER